MTFCHTFSQQLCGSQILHGKRAQYAVFEASVRQTLAISCMFMWIILAALAFGADDSAVQAFEAAARARKIPLKCLRDSFEGGREKYEQRLILVRPDQFVVWTGDQGPEDADQLMGRVSGQG